MDITLTAKQRALQLRLEKANINPTSFLATDYLNHYNEIVMLMEMVPDMPELAEDTFKWAPKGYVDHFLESGFLEKDLAVEAYRAAPKVVRDTFESICKELDAHLLTTISGLKSINIAERGMTIQAQLHIRVRVKSVYDLLSRLNQVIHGKLEGLVPPSQPMPETIEADTAHTQEEIDALFD